MGTNTTELLSILLQKLLWITSICAWPIERGTIEIIVNRAHLCVIRACYYWNYCESQTFVRDLSSVLLFKFWWITIFYARPIERVTIEIMVKHEHYVVIYEYYTMSFLTEINTWIWVINLHNYKYTDSACFLTISALIIFWTWICEFTFTATDNMRFVL